MTDQPPTYETAEDLLARARELFVQADQELARGLGRNVDEDHMSRLYRANLLFTGASAGFRGAQAMIGLQHLDLLREFEGRVDARTATNGNGQPGVFPCPDCGQVFVQLTALDHHLDAEHDRDPYEPPTLTGPYDPDRTHDR